MKCHWPSFTIFSSVRATNVYEERSLGIFNDEDIDVENFKPVGSRISIWSKYLALHARKQLSFGELSREFFIGSSLSTCSDMWWLSLALFLICIIEVILPDVFMLLTITKVYRGVSS